MVDIFRSSRRKRSDDVSFYTMVHDNRFLVKFIDISYSEGSLFGHSFINGVTLLRVCLKICLNIMDQK